MDDDVIYRCYRCNLIFAKHIPRHTSKYITPPSQVLRLYPNILLIPCGFTGIGLRVIVYILLSWDGLVWFIGV